MNGHLRIGACLSLSGKFGGVRPGRRLEGLEAWRSLDGAAGHRWWKTTDSDPADACRRSLPGVASRM